MAQDPKATQPDENPRQGFSAKTPHEMADRQRTVETTRESGPRRSNLARRNPMFGTSASPFSLMRRMAEDAERLFSDTDYARVGYGLSDPNRHSSGFEPWGSHRAYEATWAPELETFRKDGKIVVRADLPGLTKDDIRIEAGDDMLSISGERTDEFKDDRDDSYRSERTYGRFFRAIPLPEGVDPDEVDASFKDGVLEVTIPEPKVQQSRNRQVTIR